jgi:hypothetical protein
MGDNILVHSLGGTDWCRQYRRMMVALERSDFKRWIEVGKKNNSARKWL